MFNAFLGHSPKWFKYTMIGFMIFNIISIFVLGPVITAWLFIGEFIFTLAMALKCYPLLSGGLLAIEAMFLGLTTPAHAYQEVSANLEVILLLVFMVAGIYFMKPLLMYIFSKVFTKVKSKLVLSLLFVFLAAVLSAFLDALTVTAVLISVTVGFYGVYHKIHSSSKDYDHSGTLDREQLSGETLVEFQGFLRSLVMHGLVGTALGGVCTLVGEPQNLLIGERMGWDFIEFFTRMSPVTIPVLFAGLATTIVLELTGWFGYGTKMPEVARGIIESYTKEMDAKRNSRQKYELWVQGAAAVLLIVGLALHLAPVGFIGLALIIFQTAFTGIIEEHRIGKAFEEALPFTGLLVVFFVIVAMIHDQHLFKPIIDYAFSLSESQQPQFFYVSSGLLSMISDNVFVATVFIGEVYEALKDFVDPALPGYSPAKADLYDKLAIAINTGTNLPSVATPNGQAAFLFLLTSTLAPLIHLSYFKMVKMAIPYTIVLSILGYIGNVYFM
jgi:NhaB family Na+:H+ antiporter